MIEKEFSVTSEHLFEHLVEHLVETPCRQTDKVLDKVGCPKGHSFQAESWKERRLFFRRNCVGRDVYPQILFVIFFVVIVDSESCS